MANALVKAQEASATANAAANAVSLGRHGHSSGHICHVATHPQHAMSPVMPCRVEQQAAYGTFLQALSKSTPRGVQASPL